MNLVEQKKQKKTKNVSQFMKIEEITLDKNKRKRNSFHPFSFNNSK